MSRWRIAVVVVLLAVPVVTLLSLGGYHLWYTGFGRYVWWPMTACVVLAYFLAWYWLRQQRLLQPIDFTPSMHWTKRDQAAWKLVEARANQVALLSKPQFNELPYYLNLGQEVAMELARFYHPEAKDPVTSLTVPELLAVIELASHDLSKLVEDNVPLSHLLTINEWNWTTRTIINAKDWYCNARNIWWLVSAFLSPVETGLRYVASHVGVTTPMQKFQQDLIAWFHTAFVHRVGYYWIEVNSHRLRVGSQRYGELMAALKTPQDNVTPQKPQTPVERGQQVTITIMGQSKMGKSSFINALLGEQRARTGVIPVTDALTRYELVFPEISSRLVLQDTVGYAHTGPKEDQLRATQKAAEQSDLLLLLLHARNPARQADLEMLRRLREWFASQPALKMPAVLAVVTHIDLLSPIMEWSPPYNWMEPQLPKEQQIYETITTIHNEMADYLVGVIPVCTAPGKVYGIDEWFYPPLFALLGDARSVEVLRCMKAEVDADKVRKVIKQVMAAGSFILNFWIQKHPAGNPPNGR